MKIHIKLILFILKAGVILFPVYACSEKPLAQYRMINVNEKTQGDAHFIKIEEQNILIDTGALSEADASLVPYLKGMGVGHIDILFISHLHWDHYQGIKPLLKAGIKIFKAYFNIPAKQVCEKDCCCDWDHAMGYIDYLKSHGTRIYDIQRANQKTFNDNSKLMILHAQKSGRYDINDTSPIMLWNIGTFRMLFTGDLNRKLSGELKHHPEIHADILKVPHHGTESLATNAFIRNVGAKVMTIPSPKTLWSSKRSKRIRNFKYKNGDEPIKLVSGVEGHIRIDLYQDHLTITTESGKNISLDKEALSRISKLTAE